MGVAIIFENSHPALVESIGKTFNDILSVIIASVLNAFIYGLIIYVDLGRDQAEIE